MESDWPRVDRGSDEYEVFVMDLPTPALITGMDQERTLGFSSKESGDELADSLPLECHERRAPVRYTQPLNAGRPGYSLQCDDGLWVPSWSLGWSERLPPEAGDSAAANRVSVANSPEQVGAIGPGAVWTSKRYLMYTNAYYEFGAENRPEGNKIVLSIQWIVGK